MLDYINGQRLYDRPDIVSHVFKVKLMHLIDDIKKINTLVKQLHLHIRSNFKKEDYLMLIIWYG